MWTIRLDSMFFPLSIAFLKKYLRFTAVNDEYPCNAWILTTYCKELLLQLGQVVKV